MVSKLVIPLLNFILMDFNLSRQSDRKAPNFQGKVGRILVTPVGRNAPNFQGEVGSILVTPVGRNVPNFQGNVASILVTLVWS